MKRALVIAAALLLVVSVLGAKSRASRPMAPGWPTVAEQLQERRNGFSALRDSYLISNISRAGNKDSIFEVAFQYRGDTLRLAIEAWWMVPQGRHRADSIGRKRWGTVTTILSPEELLASRCVGPERLDSMLVFAVARPQSADTFATPRLAWRVDTVARDFVPLSPVGLRCPTRPYFSDAIITGSMWTVAKYAVASWWADVRMMTARIAAGRQGGGAGS